jgi:hypothetical protein
VFVCTVVVDVRSGGAVRILALRDEFVDRDFDLPERWWPDQPDVVGGRDRSAGGTWCASAISTGTTALLVNRIERREGRPTRGLLPLRALARGAGWADGFDHTAMASFNLILAGPPGVTVWVWDGTDLARDDLGDGPHLITSAGVDAADPKSLRFGAELRAGPWPGVVTACEPEADISALVVRRPIDERTYATVFGQLIEARPGRLDVEYSRTPWVAGSWAGTSWV